MTLSILIASPPVKQWLGMPRGTAWKTCYTNALTLINATPHVVRQYVEPA